MADRSPRYAEIAAHCMRPGRRAVRLTVTTYKPGPDKVRIIAGEVPGEVWERGS